MTKKDIGRIEDVLNSEGFDYGFIHYTSFDEIKDEEFHRLRLAYVEAQEKLQAYLEEQGVNLEL